jgi:cysteine-rich repeat protein
LTSSLEVRDNFRSMYRWSRFVVASSLFLGPLPALAWQTAVSESAPAGRASAIAVDALGDVLTVGRSVNAAGNEDAIAAKLDGKTGAEQWHAIAAGSTAGDDYFRTLAVTGTSFVAVGQTVETATAADILLTSFAADGTSPWSVQIDGGAGLEDEGFAVALDGGGDVLVAAQSTPSGQTSARFTVLKRQGSDGGPIWRTELSSGRGTGRAVVVQGSAVFVAGDAAGLIVAAKLDDATGMPAWRTDVAGAAGEADVGRALAVGAGRVVVAGRFDVSGSDDPNFAVVALDATTGTEMWRRSIDGTLLGGADEDDAFGVAIDAAGDVIAAGRITNTDTDDDLLVVKLAGATGADLWRTVIDGRNDNADVAQALALDASGNVLVAGTVRNPGTRADLLVLKLANATGAELWRAEVNGSEDGADTGLAVAASGADVVAAGRVQNGATADGYAVVKRTGANGGDFPCANGADDPGEACDDGNVAAGDGCRADCTLEVCGDGIKDPQEGCDDGNDVDGDCCSPTCVADPDGASCDDGDACTLDDHCEAGACTPATVVACPANTPCELGVCDHAVGTCSIVQKAEGAPCDDADVCSVLDRCVASVCTGSFEITCDDQEPCTTDGCDPVAGCTTTPVEGFASVTCTFERGRIASACTSGLPRPIQSRVDRTRTLVTKASELATGRRRVKLLRRAGAALQQAIRKTGVLQKRGTLTAACGAAVTAELGDIRTRNDALRATLTP